MISANDRWRYLFNLLVQHRISEFASRNMAVVACPADSELSRWKWLQTEPGDGGIKGVK